jgi:lipopolysaccharide transport system permease protein
MLLGFNQTDLVTVRQLTWRQIKAKFSQTILGLSWAVITPLVLLSVYGVVYSGVFKAEWIRNDGTSGDYALFIFSGLVIFTLTAEVMNGSTFLVRSNNVLVKRTSVNPSILPIVSVLSAGFFFIVSLIPFCVYYIWREGIPPVTALLFPVPILLLALFLLGVSYFLSALSVYFQDLQQLIPLLVTVLLFLSPVFYSVSQLPVGIQSIIVKVNPLASVIEAVRDLIFNGTIPSLTFFVGFAMVASITALTGYKFYKFASIGFADVV